MICLEASVLAETSKFYSAKIENTKSSITDEILVKHVKEKWVATRLINGTVIQEKTLNSYGITTVHIRVRQFLLQYQTKKISNKCYEIFELRQKQNQKIRGCAVENEDFSRFFLNLSRIFWDPQMRVKRSP